MTFIDKIREFGFKNETGEEIPPFGCMVITGATDQGGELVFSIRKPTQADEDLQEPASILFNSIQPVPDDEFGVGYRDFPLQALVDQPSADHAAGIRLGYRANSFSLEVGNGFFRILAKDLTDPHVQAGCGVYFIEECYGLTDFYIGKASNGILGRVDTQMYSGDVVIYEENLSGVLSAKTGGNFDGIQAYNISGEAILEDAWIKIWRLRNKYYCQGLCS